VNAVRTWLRERFATPSAIYGLVLYSAVIAATSDHADDTLEVLTVAGITLIVFFIAHAFAEILAAHGAHRLRDAFRKGLAHSVGMLYAAILPTIVLIVWSFIGGSADAAADIALIAAVLVLGLLGFEAFAQRGAAWWARLLGALGTALFGGVVILLDYFVH